MPEPAAEIYLYLDHIMVRTSAGDTSGSLRLGQTYFIGAVARELYPYEVAISVIKRRDDADNRI